MDEIIYNFDKYLPSMENVKWIVTFTVYGILAYYTWSVQFIHESKSCSEDWRNLFLNNIGKSKQERIFNKVLKYEKSFQI